MGKSAKYFAPWQPKPKIIMVPDHKCTKHREPSCAINKKLIAMESEMKVLKKTAKSLIHTDHKHDDNTGECEKTKEQKIIDLKNKEIL